VSPLTTWILLAVLVLAAIGIIAASCWPDD
jgi:hypothetical protein